MNTTTLQLAHMRTLLEALLRHVNTDAPKFADIRVSSRRWISSNGRELLAVHLADYVGIEVCHGVIPGIVAHAMVGILNAVGDREAKATIDFASNTFSIANKLAMTWTPRESEFPDVKALDAVITTAERGARVRYADESNGVCVSSQRYATALGTLEMFGKSLSGDTAVEMLFSGREYDSITMRPGRIDVSVFTEVHLVLMPMARG